MNIGMPMSGVVLPGMVAIGKRTGTIERKIEWDSFRIQTCGCHHRLPGRAGWIGALHSTIVKRMRRIEHYLLVFFFRGSSAEKIEIEIWFADKRQNFSGIRIERYNSTASGFT